MKLFNLPDLGEGIPDADIIEWHISPGDKVTQDQIIVAVETAKAIVEIPSPVDGVIEKLFGEPGDTIHTGQPLVQFKGQGEADSGTVVGKIETAQGQSEEDHFFIGSSPSSAEQLAGMAPAAPHVRALARELNIPLESLQLLPGNTHITAQQVKEAYRATQTATPTFQFEGGEPLKGVRKHMARTMADSHAQVVPVTLCDNADIEHWPEGTDTTIKVIKAIAAACQAEPALNAWFDGKTLHRLLHKQIDLGIAVDAKDGLFVPILHNIAERSDIELREGLELMKGDVKQRDVPPEEMRGATITLSNFGTMAGRYANPIVVPPMVCIIGTGLIRREAIVAESGNIEAHRILPLSLTFDHRAVTGGEAARFLHTLIKSLQDN